MQITIKLTGSFCNDWPNCRIKLNGHLLDDFQVTNEITKTYNVELEEQNTLSIQHYGKRFGEHRIWDTKLVDGVIVKDRFFSITDIEFNDVTIKDLWHNGVVTGNRFDGNIPQHSTTLPFNDNREYSLSFTSPIYTWIIEKRNEGFKGIGPAWRRSKLDSKPDGYSISFAEIENIIDSIKKDIDLL